MAENDLVVNFSLSDNNNLTPSFGISEGESFDTLFKIDAQLAVEGEGVINAVTSNGKVTITSTTYTHEQGIASDMWIITHNLNKYPSVTLVDTAGTQFQGRVEYIDENSCKVYMNGATKGKAYLN